MPIIKHSLHRDIQSGRGGRVCSVGHICCRASLSLALCFDVCVCVCRLESVSVYVLSSHSRKKEINSVRHLDLQYEATRARINRQSRLNMAV
jgi:hypothetical protein